MSAILNPWPGLQARPYNNVRQITVRIPREVAERIESVFGGAGFMTGVTHTIIKVIYDELNNNHIIGYDPEFLIGVVRRLSAAVSPRSVPVSNVPGGTAIVHSQPTPLPPSSDVEVKGNKRATKRTKTASGNKGQRRTKSSGAA